MIGLVDLDEFWSWARTISWVGWVAIVAIVCGFIITISKVIFRHIEEMERIRKGKGSKLENHPSPKRDTFGKTIQPTN